MTSARIQIVKGSTAHGIRKGPGVFSVFFEATDLGVRVSLYGRYYFLAGNRKTVPIFESGHRYNMHRGDPTKCITIEIR